MGFDLGADDYISKPFRVNELMAESEVCSEDTTVKQAKAELLSFTDLKLIQTKQRFIKMGQR